jgi:hypothetical protein
MSGWFFFCFGHNMQYDQVVSDTTTATAIVEPAQALTKTGSALFDNLWQAAAIGDSAPTADLLAAWARRFILFHDKRRPREMEPLLHGLWDTLASKHVNRP